MQKLLRGFFLCSGVALLLNGVHVTLVSNLNFGTLLVFLLGALLLTSGLFWMRLWKWVRAAAVCGVALLLALCCALTLYGSLDTANGNEDALVVLGCGLRGARVSVGLARRLDKALAFYEAHPGVLLVVSGGQGTQETITEAEAMERYLETRGVPKEQILKEEQATSTLENLQFSDAMLSERFPGGCRAALVTSRFHVFRASRIAAALGLSYTHLGASGKWYAMPMNTLRELCAIAHELLRGTL